MAVVIFNKKLNLMMNAKIVVKRGQFNCLQRFVATRRRGLNSNNFQKQINDEKSNQLD